MNASSLSGECARRISWVFGEAAGVDMLGPSWLWRGFVTHPGFASSEDYDAPAVFPVAVKETKVCASSGESAEYTRQEYHTRWRNVQTPRRATGLSHRRSRLESRLF